MHFRFKTVWVLLVATGTLLGGVDAGDVGEELGKVSRGCPFGAIFVPMRTVLNVRCAYY
jgi:hypothetical protein